MTPKILPGDYHLLRGSVIISSLNGVEIYAAGYWFAGFTDSHAIHPVIHHPENIQQQDTILIQKIFRYLQETAGFVGHIFGIATPDAGSPTARKNDKLSLS